MAKTNKKQALGRGLSALLQDPKNDIKEANDKNAKEIVGNVLEIELDSIEINPFQPRTNFNDEALAELSSSIKELGIIQPITVRKIDFNKYQLISGERRLRASKLAGLSTIPAFIRLANDQESLEMALVENIQRQDLDPIEISLSYQRLMDEIKLTQDELSIRVGKKRSTITNYLRLLKLNPIIQTGMRDGFLSMGHGRALVNVKDEEQQLKIYQEIVSKNISVRQTEDLVRNYQENDGQQKNKKETVTKTAIKIPEYIDNGKKQLEDYFSSEVQISLVNNKKGKLVIPFNSKKEFENLIKRIK